MPAVVQLTRRGLLAEAQDVGRLRSEFDARSFILLERFLEPYLLSSICTSLDQGQWNRMDHDGVGSEQVLWHDVSVPLLRFLVNLPDVLAFVHDITGCGPFTSFDGRVYRLTPDAGDYDSWHDDLGNGMVAMSLNLSDGYKGGAFQMRERDSDALLVDFVNAGLGDATLFRISDRFVHRITRVQPGPAKTAFAGWFETGTVGILGRRRQLDRIDVTSD